MMLEVLYYLCLAKEIAFVLIQVVVVVLASVFMVVGLLTCLRSLKEKKKEEYGGIVHKPPDHINCPSVFTKEVEETIKRMRGREVKPIPLPIALWKEFKIGEKTVLVHPAYEEAARELLKKETTTDSEPKVTFTNGETGKEEKWKKKTIWKRDESGGWALKTIWVREDSV